MKYIVIVEFTDLQDNNRKYLVGDSFPRKGLLVSEKRLEELSTGKNRRGFPVIKAVDEPKPVEEPQEQEIEAPVEKPTTKRGKKK